MPLATSTSMTSLAHCGEPLDHLYMPHGKYSRFFGQKLQCLGKGAMLRAGRATTSYLRIATLGAQAIAVVTKIWKIWDGFHKELYLYGHPSHLRPLQGLCVPNIIGVFSTSEGLANIAMEPPHPHAWRVADRSLSMDEKRAVVEAYSQIHARGVLHGDVALRHMLIGRDGKPTIINFRHASCLQPPMKIGISGCSTREFQLEMRQVKFLLDYQGAREFEYQLARSVTRTNTREGVNSIVPFPISEITLQQWDASTLEDLTPPSLPFYVPNTPDISIRPVSWISSDVPLSVDNPDSEETQLHHRISPDHSFDQIDDRDDIQPSPSHSRLKGKQPENHSNSDVVGHASDHIHKQLYSESSPIGTEEMFSNSCHLIHDSEQHEPSMSAVPRSAVTSDDYMVSPSLSHSSLDGAAFPDQFLLSLPLGHDNGHSPPLLWTPLSLTTSHAPPPDHVLYNQRLSRPKQEPVARHEYTPQLDYTSDSSSDTNVSTSTSYGYVDTEPPSPDRALVTLQDDVPSFTTIDILSFFDPLSDTNIECTGQSLLQSVRPSFKTRGPISAPYKRKRLFLAEEDEYGERACKQRCIEQ